MRADFKIRQRYFVRKGVVNLLPSAQKKVTAQSKPVHHWSAVVGSLLCGVSVLIGFAGGCKQVLQPSASSPEPARRVEQPTPPQAPEASSTARLLKVRVESGTLLKSAPRPSQQPDVVSCPLASATEYLLLGQAEPASDSHYKVVLRELNSQTLSDCQLKNSLTGAYEGFVYAPHVEGVGFQLPAPRVAGAPGESTQTVVGTSGALSDFDEATAEQLASKIKTFVTKQGTRCSGSSSLGKCYECVGQLLGEPLRAGEPIWPWGVWEELNRNQWARSFADTFNAQKDLWQQRLKMKPIHDQVSPQQAPRGAIIVWEGCSSNPAGHIEIVTQKGTACSDFCRPITNCDRLLGIYMPIR